MDTNQDRPSTRRPPLVGLGVVILLSIVPFLVGCDLVARAVDEKYEERVHANELFDQFDADCPQRINSYTTLTGVTNSLGDICFTYQARNSGESHYKSLVSNGLNPINCRRQCLRRWEGVGSTLQDSAGSLW